MKIAKPRGIVSEGVGWERFHGSLHKLAAFGVLGGDGAAALGELDTQIGFDIHVYGRL